MGKSKLRQRASTRVTNRSCVMQIFKINLLDSSSPRSQNWFSKDWTTERSFKLPSMFVYLLTLYLWCHYSRSSASTRTLFSAKSNNKTFALQNLRMLTALPAATFWHRRMSMWEIFSTPLSVDSCPVIQRPDLPASVVAFVVWRHCWSGIASVAAAVYAHEWWTAWRTTSGSQVFSDSGFH